MSGDFDYKITRFSPPIERSLPILAPTFDMLHPPLPRAFYDRDVVTVARELLGKLLVRRVNGGLTVGRIVEAEAYLAAGDSASHCFSGRKRRNASLFGPPGHAYLYSIHARWCLNAL